MCEAFFEQKGLIPKEQFCEVRFEDLEKDKIGQIRRIYETLALDGFQSLESKLQAYVSSISNYQKNRYPPLPESLRQRIRARWPRCMEKFA